MKSFKDYNKVDDTTSRQQDIQNVLEYLMILDAGEDDILLSENKLEGIRSTFTSLAKKMGISGESKKTLLGLLSTIGKKAALTLVYAIQASAGSESAKEKLKEIVKDRQIYSELSDLVIRLDVLTLHMISGPIHMIDALTGWDIADKIREQALGVTNKINTAIDTISSSAQKHLNTDKSKRVQKKINQIKNLFIPKQKTRGRAR
jgi:hypothetical protein